MAKIAVDVLLKMLKYFEVVLNIGPSVCKKLPNSLKRNISLNTFKHYV